jgi:hypothetical protein
MLELISRSLAANQIPFILLSGNVRDRAKQIQAFQSDASQKVFLLSLRTDNSGLTLVNAQHVFLAEPSLNLAVEAQAINRVHRIGQTRRTFVHKFVMRNSIEQKIVETQAQQRPATDASGKPSAALTQREKEVCSPPPSVCSSRSSLLAACSLVFLFTSSVYVGVACFRAPSVLRAGRRERRRQVRLAQS